MNASRFVAEAASAKSQTRISRPRSWRWIAAVALMAGCWALPSQVSAQEQLTESAAGQPAASDEPAAGEPAATDRPAARGQPAALSEPSASDQETPPSQAIETEPTSATTVAAQEEQAPPGGGETASPQPAPASEGMPYPASETPSTADGADPSPTPPPEGTTPSPPAEAKPNTAVDSAQPEIPKLRLPITLSDLGPQVDGGGVLEPPEPPEVAPLEDRTARRTPRSVGPSLVYPLDAAEHAPGMAGLLGTPAWSTPGSPRGGRGDPASKPRAGPLATDIPSETGRGSGARAGVGSSGTGSSDRSSVSHAAALLVLFALVCSAWTTLLQTVPTQLPPAPCMSRPTPPG